MKSLLSTLVLYYNLEKYLKICQILKKYDSVRRILAIFIVCQTRIFIRISFIFIQVYLLEFKVISNSNQTRAWVEYNSGSNWASNLKLRARLSPNCATRGRVNNKIRELEWGIECKYKFLITSAYSSTFPRKNIVYNVWWNFDNTVQISIIYK